MKPRQPLPRISKKRLASNGGKTPFLKRSAIRKRPRKPIRKVNPKAKAKRKIAYRKMLSGKEYKAARAAAFERAGDRCEFGKQLNPALPETVYGWGLFWAERCPETEHLHAHHKSYPKTRP